MFTDLGYVALFVASFLAATVVPLSSDVVFAGMLLAGFDPYISLAVASVGNWMGGMVSYYIGWLGKWEWIEKYLRVKASRIEKIQKKVAGKEGWIAFFTWLPGIGDPLAIALGVIKARPVPTAIWMFIGKTTRYIFWALVTLGAVDLFSN